MVSAFLMAIVMGMLFSILIGTMNAWDGGTSRLQTNSDARMALDMIARDLQSMVVRQTQMDQQWLSSEPDEVKGLTSTWLTFFAPSIDRDTEQEGDIVAISYRVGYQDPVSTNDYFEVFGLYKQMATTEDTFRDALGQTELVTGFWEGGSSAPDPLLREGFLVPNVVRFEVSWWVEYPGESSPVRLGSDYLVALNNVLQIGTAGATMPAFYPGAKIVAADITLTVLDDQGMQDAQLLDEAGSLNADKLEDLIRLHGRVHTSRVKITY
jgi:hypothetical protein